MADINNQNNDNRYNNGSNNYGQNYGQNRQSSSSNNFGQNRPYNPYTQQQNNINQQQAEKQKQEDLENLGKKLMKDDKAQDRKESAGLFFRRMGIIVLVLILIGGIGVSIYFFGKGTGNVTSGGLIKLSISVTENIENMSPSDQTISTAKVYPGEKFGVTCKIRNADSIYGDNDSTGTSIFVRYSIKLVLDGKNYNNVVVPVIPNLSKHEWHVYNSDEEFEDYVWDGWYYYYGSLLSDQSLTLFDEIEFDFHNTTNDFGNKHAQIQIVVEAVQADLGNIGVESGNAWNTAPRKWINNMQKHIDNDGNSITI